jgi:ABC-type sugar transport system ATPase subunit
MAVLVLDKLNLVYGGGGRGRGDATTHAVRDVDLVVGDGEFCVFLGPSGCGKTSTLRMIAGLETPTGGEILLDGRPITRLYPGERDIAMVFQSYALYPHLTVRGHFELPLEAQKVPKAERARRVAEIAALLQMTEVLDARPRQLSGGQSQRTAIGRALIRQPKLFLLDEPLTNLDARLRLETRATLKRLQSELGITTVYVTHDQEEALSLADSIVVMHDGRVQQVADARTLYAEPANRFVAGFIGTPPMNFASGQLRFGGGDGVGAVLQTSTVSVPLPGVAAVSALPPETAVTLGIRPEDVVLVAEPDGDCARGRVVVVEPLGDERILSVALGAGGEGPVWKVRAPKDGVAGSLAPGASVGLSMRARGLRFFDPASEARVA